MSDQILVVESNESYIQTSKGQLVVRLRDSTSTRPIEDLFALVIDTPGASITSAAMRALALKGTLVIVTDEKHLPASLLIPLVGHTLLQKRLCLQIETTLPTKKRVWREIVIQKLRAQARTLINLVGDDNNILSLSGKVTSGDSSNIEA